MKLYLIITLVRIIPSPDISYLRNMNRFCTVFGLNANKLKNDFINITKNIMGSFSLY